MLSPGISPKETLERIISAARNLGTQTSIHRLPPNQAPSLKQVLPVVAEMRDHAYWVIDDMHDRPDTGTAITRVTIPQPSGETEIREMDIKDFAGQWSGCALGFQRINTALVCFSILAREHKIEVTIFLWQQR